MVSTKGEQVSVHLKEFSLVSPKIASKEILKAIEIAMTACAIEQAIAKTNVEEKRHRACASTTGSVSGNRHEPVVKRFNAGCNTVQLRAI
jgi:hypothetical protein